MRVHHVSLLTQKIADDLHADWPKIMLNTSWTDVAVVILPLAKG